MSTRGRVPTNGLSNSVGRPRLIWAPSPDDRSAAVRLFVDPETIEFMSQDRRDTGLAMYMGHIHGAVSYTDPKGRSKAKTGNGLLDATALFRGIHRPMIEDRLDEQVYAYITNPNCTYVCPQDRHRLRLGPLEATKPSDSVFTTFVLFDDETVRRWDRQIRLIGGEQVDGIVIDWEWTLADPNDPSLPDDHDARYDERKW